MSLSRNGGPERRTPLARTVRLEPGPPPSRRTRIRPVSVKRAAALAEGRKAATGTTGAATGLPRLPGGFTDTVKARIRARAGHGDPAQARCEATGVFLGEHDGEFQHIVARGAGGSRNPVINSAANGALLSLEAHRLAETRSALMRRLGFWQPQGTDPRLAPMVLYGLSGGTGAVWRSEAEPRYLDEAPGTETAA